MGRKGGGRPLLGDSSASLMAVQNWANVVRGHNGPYQSNEAVALERQDGRVGVTGAIVAGLAHLEVCERYGPSGKAKWFASWCYTEKGEEEGEWSAHNAEVAPSFPFGELCCGAAATNTVTCHPTWW